jgi:hypothetical protein
VLILIFRPEIIFYLYLFYLFLESLLHLADRLTGPFNVEHTILQLDISISNAIMNFQDSGMTVNEFNDCNIHSIIVPITFP